VGKSIDIPTRWKQHQDKLYKGTAAAAMQQEFNLYRQYDQRIIYECHSDHLDILEAYFINSISRETSLNTTIPKFPFEGMTQVQVDELLIWLHKGTKEIVADANLLNNYVTTLREEVQRLETQVTSLDKKRSMQEIKADLAKKLDEQADTIIVQDEAIYSLLDEKKKLQALLVYANRSWWNKLFN
jgi:hypothetical protein